MTDAHHHAARHHERGRGETELFGTQQRGNNHISAGLELAIGLNDDPVTQTVKQERLLGLGEAKLPRTASMLERGQRRRAGTAVVS